jgi:hypothetical protein
MPDGAELKITEVPMTLAPELWNALAPEHLSDNGVANLRCAHAEMLRALTGVVNTHRSVMADPTQTPAMNLGRSHAHAQKLKSLALDKAERALTRSREDIRAIDEATSRVPDGPDSVTAAALGSALRSLKADERRGILSNALKVDDRLTLSAVLFKMPAWYSGLSDAERDLYVAEYKSSRYPQALAKRAALEKGVEILEKGMKSLEIQIGALYDEGKLRDAERRAAQAQLALGGV